MTEVAFTDLLVAIVDNRGRTAPTAEAGIPLIATNCIKDDALYPVKEKVRYVDGETYANWFRGHPLPGDILFVCKGSPGRTALVPDPVDFCVAQDMVAVRADPAKVYPKFLLAALRSSAVRTQVSNMHVGTMIPHFKKGDFGKLRIPVPDRATQEAIGDLYFVLSERIESNRRATTLLDELSRTVFQRWRPDAAVQVNSSFGAFAEVFGGATPKTAVPEHWDGDLAWATPTDVTALTAPYLFDTARKITRQGLASCAAVLHPPGTIFMTSRATIGAFALNQTPAATNQGFIAVRPRRSQDRWFLLEEMRSRVPEFLENANGSTFLEVSRGRFKELPLAVPPATAIDELAAQLGPLHVKAAQLAAESCELARVRDAILPAILTGRTRFSATSGNSNLTEELEVPNGVPDPAL